MTIEQTKQDYREYVKKIMDFKEAIALAEWDLRTGAPKKGVSQRSAVIGTLADEVYTRSIAPQMKAYIDELTDVSVLETLDQVTQRMLEQSKKEYERNVRIPQEENKAYIVLQSEAQTVWEEAKAKGNFALLSPYLEKMVTLKRRFIAYWGKEKHAYDALLDLYEPGLTVTTIDDIFDKLQQAIVPLVREVTDSGTQPSNHFLFKDFPQPKLKAFCLHLLHEIGYDFGAGRLDETEHPFEITLNPGDVRVTTHYLTHDFMSTVLGTVHEGGHALYEQHISRELVGTPLCQGTSMGIHESQSLFFENFIGRSKPFWQRHLPKLKIYGGAALENVSLDDFYRAINVSRPSLIRIYADELTYPLHIMVRYELEKALFNADLNVCDLPGAWNEKMQAYLGIVPENDRDGVLQDIHWPSGDFGYFPSYALGYVYAAQFRHKMQEELPDFNERVAGGKLEAVTGWLSRNVHVFGSLKKPLEILRDATGEGPNPDYLIAYLKEKYRGIYKL
ncbi:MAG: carboxypeptidase M32 [Sporolactobacillus sp.]